MGAIGGPGRLFPKGLSYDQQRLFVIALDGQTGAVLRVQAYLAGGGGAAPAVGADSVYTTWPDSASEIGLAATAQYLAVPWYKSLTVYGLGTR